MPFLADSLNLAEPKCHLAEVVSDMKLALKPDLYKKLIDHSFHLAPPYLPLFQFSERNPKRKLVSMLMIDWETDAVKKGFGQFMEARYPDESLKTALVYVQKYVLELQKGNWILSHIFRT